MSIKGADDGLSTFPLAFPQRDPSPADPPVAAGHAGPICLLVQGVTEVLLAAARHPRRLSEAAPHGTAIPPSNEAPLGNWILPTLFRPF